MTKNEINKRAARFIAAGAYTAVALGAFSISLFGLPAPQNEVNSTPIKPTIAHVEFKPVIGELQIADYKWAELTMPEPIVVVEPVPAPIPEPAPVPVPAPAPAVHVDPGSAQETARNQVLARGWGEDQFSCLVSLWDRESNWRADAMNSSSGAYGIPQALPGDKMASAGADWQTNPATQIAWGLGYITDRYGNPCGALDHSHSVGWY